MLDSRLTNLQKLSALLLVIFITALAGGCAGQVRPEISPQELQDAVAAAKAGNRVWNGINATLRPDKYAYGGHNFTLNAVYRVDEHGKTKFALFMPHGAKLGQCDKTEKRVKCSSQSFPGAARLVRSAFNSLDELFSLAPEQAEQYEMCWGDKTAGLDSTQKLLRHRIPAQANQPGSGGSSYLLTTPAGVLKAAYRLGRPSGSQSRLDRSLAWKAVFDEELNYRFMPQDGGWIVDVAITRRLE
jgi:hypothetical protein